MQDAMKDMDSFESESIPPPPPRSTLALKAANGTTDPQPGAQKCLWTIHDLVEVSLTYITTSARHP